MRLYYFAANLCAVGRQLRITHKPAGGEEAERNAGPSVTQSVIPNVPRAGVAPHHPSQRGKRHVVPLCVIPANGCAQQRNGNSRRSVTPTVPYAEMLIVEYGTGPFDSVTADERFTGDP
jgi:hypothetical protein